MELRGHRNDHVVVVGVEVTTFWNVKTKWRRVVEASEQVVWVVRQTWLMGCGPGQVRWPDTLVGILGLMHSHVGRPDSVTDHTLAIVPFLEVITFVLLMCGVDFGKEDHLLGQFVLSETFVYEQVVALVHSTVASLAGSAEDLKTSSESAQMVKLKMSTINSNELAAN